MLINNWASTREKNLSSGACEKQRHRPACAYAQSDQRIGFLPFRKHYIQTCYMRILNFLASLCIWAGWFRIWLCLKPQRRGPILLISHEFIVIILINLLLLAIWVASKEMLQSHAADQPMAPWGRDIKHKQPCNYLDKSASFSNLDGMPNEMLQSHTADQPMAPWGRNIEQTTL